MPIVLNGTTGITTPTYNGSTTAEYLVPVTGFKNRIINGAMKIWQRGTSSSSIGYQTVDRWSFYADSSRTVSRSTDVPTGFQYSTSLSGTGSTGLTQKIESVNCYGIAGNSITISFWLKQTTGAGSNAIGLNLYYANAADDWNASTQISTTQNFTTTSGWAQYTATFSNMPANSVNGLQVTIVTNSGSAVVFLLTGVQLEVGSTATSFDYLPYGTELALCQRYCNKLTYENTGAVVTGYIDSATSARGAITFPTMRTSASVTASSGTHFKLDNGAGAYVGTGISFDGLTPTSARMILNSSGMTANQGGIFLSVNNSAYILLTAEL